MRVLRVISFAFLMAVLAMGTLAGSPSATYIAAASAFAYPAFQTQWGAGEAVTPSFYGPLATAHDGQTEKYVEATGGQRVVQYFDKARLELTNPSTGLVTSGLLASELVKGQIQVGDGAFQNQTPPAIPIAGDPDNTGPTYAQLSAKGKGLFDAAPAQTGNYAQAAVSPTGDISVGGAGATDPATFTVYDDPTKHNVPRAFADYRAKAGLTTIGYALSEPFATTVRVAGTQRQVLVQVFERRVLTYTASNPDTFKVEFGNIGAHYYRWRYPNGGTVATVAPAVVAPPTTAPPTPAPPPAGMQAAPATANYQIVASVSNPSPTQNSRVTVNAKLTNGGAGVSGATLDTTWHYKTTTSYCTGGPSAADGTMSCTRDISRATVGYTVSIDVTATYQGQTFTTQTSFTTR